MHTAKAIDRYIHLRADAQSNGTPEIDPRLSAIIETIFSRCIADGEYQQVRIPVLEISDLTNLIWKGNRHRPRITAARHHQANLRTNERCFLAVLYYGSRD